MNSKNVPKIRFKGFAEKWKTDLLFQLANFSKGSGYSKNDLCEVGIPIILYGRLYTQYQTTISDVNTFVAENKGSIISKGNEVVVPASGETAEDIARASAVIQSGIILGGDLNVISPNEEINSLFLALSISNGLIWRELSKKAQGKSVVHLRNGDLQEVELKYPIIAEQTQIGNYFQNIDSLITKSQNKLDKLKNIKKACLEKMFPRKGSTVPEIRFKGFSEDWEEKKLGEMVSWSKGNNLAKMVLNENAIGNAVVHYADLYKFSPVVYEVIHWSETEEGTIIPLNSLLFPMSDVTPSGVARTTTIVKKDVKAGGDTLIGTIEKDYHAEFISYQINANAQQILPLVTGTTVRHISSISLSTLNIQLPTFAEQKQIGNYFQNLDNLIAKNEQKLDKLKNIKKGCLEKMFVNE